MYLIEIIPLLSLPKESPQVLSYFASKKIPRGSLVLVPFKKKEIKGIVLESQEIEKVKGVIKKSAFSLKPVKKVILEKIFFPDYFFDLAKWLSAFYLSPLTLSFKTIFPARIEKFPRYWQEKEKINQKKEGESEEIFSGKIKIFQEIKEEIAKEKDCCSQFLIVCPETTLAKKIFSSLKKDFSETTLLPTSDKQLAWLWQEIWQKKGKIVITQRKGLFLPFRNLKKIFLVEGENFFHKQEKQRPFLDNREIAQEISQLTKAELEIFYLTEDRYFQKRINQSQVEVVDLKKEKKLPEIFSSKVINLLQKTKNKKFLFYLNRKGYARYLLCQDCRRTMNCPNCSVPLVYHKERGNSYLLCHHCLFKREVPERCPNCSGYLIEEKGVGNQKVFQALSKNLRGVIFDSQYLKNFNQEEEVIRTILEKKFDFVVASELILKWFFSLEKVFDYSIIISADSLLSFPFFDTSERFFLQVQKLKFISREVLLQTFNPNLSIFSEIKKREEFFEREKERREKFSLPLPSFYRFRGGLVSKLVEIKLSHRSANFARKEIFLLARKLREKGLKFLGPSSSFIFKEKGLFSYEIFVILRNEEEKKMIEEIASTKNLLLKVF